MVRSGDVLGDVCQGLAKTDVLHLSVERNVGGMEKENFLVVIVLSRSEFRVEYEEAREARR